VRARGRAGHASVPALGENALLKLLPAIERLGAGRPDWDVTDPPRLLLEALGEDGADPAAAIAAIAQREPRLSALVEPMLRITFAPTMIAASEKINVIPARAEARVDGRVPPGLGRADVERRLGEVMGGDGLEVEFVEEVVGNGSAVDTPLMDAIRDWAGEADPQAEVVPTILPAFTDSRWWRHAFPDCVAYGFFPHRHQSWYETYPLLHAPDERIDLRDLGLAADCYSSITKTLLG
jgi:acetylornithine deacetylase/succinyl-diaminopimelate desuccinylase-like protein